MLFLSKRTGRSVALNEILWSVCFRKVVAFLMNYAIRVTLLVTIFKFIGHFLNLTVFSMLFEFLT